ncbi:MAG: hypothetical protein H6718_10180 [Polyangiaceae bacterium]|nr:hypothetical protein [Myxococcales bacterium]MCB9585758.1 hypothetical protein [Polyangiaceae bacterium]MCB9607313.1 hypothetical protein [Polyangiaceae bacterium]
MNSKCEPVVLFEVLGRSGGDGIDVSSSEVLFTDYDGGFVLAVPKAGGPERTVADQQPNAYLLDVDGNSVYWTRNKGITTSGIDGSARLPLIENLTFAKELVAGGGVVLFKDAHITSITLGSSGGVQDVSSNASAHGVHYYKGAAYFLDILNGGTVLYAGKSGGTSATTFASQLSGGQTLGQLVMNADLAYYTVGAQSWAGALKRVAKNGTPEPWASGHQVRTLQTSGDLLIWSELASDSDLTSGSLWLDSTQTSSPKQLLESTDHVKSLVIDGDAVFYSVETSAKSYRIMKLSLAAAIGP